LSVYLDLRGRLQGDAILQAAASGDDLAGQVVTGFAAAAAAVEIGQLEGFLLHQVGDQAYLFLVKDRCPEMF